MAQTSSQLVDRSSSGTVFLRKYSMKDFSLTLRNLGLGSSMMRMAMKFIKENFRMIREMVGVKLKIIRGSSPMEILMGGGD